jgi:hypothetical protein
VRGVWWVGRLIFICGPSPDSSIIWGWELGINVQKCACSVHILLEVFLQQWDLESGFGEAWRSVGERGDRGFDGEGGGFNVMIMIMME